MRPTTGAYHPGRGIHPVIVETPWVLYVDRRELVTFMCSPVGLQHLALGFLLSEGMIDGLDDVWQIKVYLDEDRVYMYFPAAGLDGELRMQTCEEAVGSIDVRLRRPPPARSEKRILTSGCGGGVTFDDLSGDSPPLQSELRISPAQVSSLMRQLNESATLYRTSRGVHTSALADPSLEFPVRLRLYARHLLQDWRRVRETILLYSELEVQAMRNPKLRARMAAAYAGMYDRRGPIIEQGASAHGVALPLSGAQTSQLVGATVRGLLQERIVRPEPVDEQFLGDALLLLFGYTPGDHPLP